MVGIDLFFKSAAAGMKLAQLWVENMFKMMELFAGLPCQKNNLAKEKAPDSNKTQYAFQKTVKEESPEPHSEKTVPVHKVKPEQPSKVASPSATETDNSRKPGPALPQKGYSAQKKSSNATEEIRSFLAKQKQGATVDDIMKTTGFPKKKVQDILYKLKRRGELTSQKGIYSHV